VGENLSENLGAFTDDVLVVLIVTILAGSGGNAWEPFEVLYQRYVKEVLNTVYRFLLKHYSLSDEDLAWQLTQETFLRAWEHLPQKNPKSPFLAWVKLIGINQARQYMRQQNRIIAIKDLIQYPPDDLVLLSQSPEDQVVMLLSRAELRGKIERVKLRLSPKQRLVLTLHLEQGYPIQQIAVALHIKPSSVTQTLSRATHRFKEEWIKEEGEPGIPVSTRKPKKGGTPNGSNNP
jgi:RNA polymerase sigma-70 factor (ECF subfamily)